MKSGWSRNPVFGCLDRYKCLKSILPSPLFRAIHSNGFSSMSKLPSVWAYQSAWRLQNYCSPFSRCATLFESSAHLHGGLLRGTTEMRPCRGKCEKIFKIGTAEISPLVGIFGIYPFFCTRQYFSFYGSRVTQTPTLLKMANLPKASHETHENVKDNNTVL